MKGTHDRNAAGDKTASVLLMMKVGLPPSTFRRSRADHTGEHKVKDYSGLANASLMMNTMVPPLGAETTQPPRSSDELATAFALA